MHNKRRVLLPLLQEIGPAIVSFFFQKPIIIIVIIILIIRFESVIRFFFSLINVYIYIYKYTRQYISGCPDERKTRRDISLGRTKNKKIKTFVFFSSPPTPELPTDDRCHHPTRYNNLRDYIPDAINRLPICIEHTPREPVAKSHRRVSSSRNVHICLHNCRLIGYLRKHEG